jgi:hypothetical protein
MDLGLESVPYITKFPVPVTLAVNCSGWETWRLTAVGEIDTDEIVGPEGVADPPPQPVRIDRDASAKARKACKWFVPFQRQKMFELIGASH